MVRASPVLPCCQGLKKTLAGVARKGMVLLRADWGEERIRPSKQVPE